MLGNRPMPLGSRIFFPIAVFLVPLALESQTLFEIRYDPASISASEDSGTAQIDLVVELVNSAPTAISDDYLVNRDLGQEFCTFSQPAPGVLANDSDPDGDPLQAVFVGPPVEGLTLNPDGSFVHQGSCYTELSFSYYATDGYFSSQVVTVNLVLNAIPRADADRLNLGYCGYPDPDTGLTTIAFDGTSSYDLVGTPLRFDWDFGDASPVAIDAGATPTHDYSGTGVFQVTLTVQDAWDAQDTDTATVTIPCTILSPTAATASPHAGNPNRPPSLVRLPEASGRSTGDTIDSPPWASMARGARATSRTVRPPEAPSIGHLRRAGVASASPTGRSSAVGAQAANTPRGTQIFTATYSATSGTATAGSDFVAVPDGSFQWTLDESFPLRFSFDVTLLDDVLAEGDETVELALASPDSEVRVLTSTGSLTITDDERLGGAAFESATYQAEETNPSITITVLLDGETPPGGGSVDYSVGGGSATSGEDFEAVSGTLTWPEGDSSAKSFEVAILQDQLSEGDETIELVLANPVGIVLGSPSLTELTINDDDTLGGSGFEASAFQVEERSGTATIVVQLRGETPPAGGSVDYAAESGTATPGQDFQPVSGSLTWPPGDSSAKTFEVPILNDDLSEDDETVELTLTNAVGIELGSPTQATLTILDDDELGTVQFRRRSFEAAEDSAAATILVDLTGSMSQAASVQYAAAPASATADQDFAAIQGTLEWEIGTTGTKTFTVEIRDDNLFEENETIALTLFNPVGIALGDPSTSTLTIVDNDQPVGVQIEGGDGQSGKAGTELDEPLLARVFNADGETVRGTTARWEVTTGEGELLDGDETETDAEGLTSNRLRLGTQLGEVQVTVTIPETGESATFNLVSELRLGELSLSPTERPVAEVLDQICNGDNPGGMRSTCDDLAELSDQDQQTAVRELTPDEVYAQGDTALAMMRVLEMNLRYRLAELRQNRRRSLDNLALNLQGVQVPVTALISSMSSAESELPDLSAAPVPEGRGGGASADETSDEAVEQADGEDWLGRRLGLFLSGTLAVGDRPTVEQEIGLELETTGLTFGVDYKFSSQFVWGGAIGYMSNDGDLKGSGGSLDSQGLSLSSYLLFMPGDRLYLDAVVSYGDIDFESERVIDFPGNRQVAQADPGGNQMLLALGGGYDISRGASSLGLFARGSYLDVDIDSYTERSAPGMQLEIDEQKLESLLATGGLEYFYNASMSWGVLTPSLRLMYNHEFEEDLRFITASFVDDPQGLSFAVATAQPDRDYFTAGFSLTATLPKGISAFATYDGDFSRDDFSYFLLTAGFRLELR